jgi:hypothetical protein
LGDGLAIYTGNLADPMFRGWLKKSTQDYAAVVQHMRAGRRFQVHLFASEWSNEGFYEEGNLWNGHAIWKPMEEDI